MTRMARRIEHVAINPDGYVAPHRPEAEAAVIAAVLADNSAFDEVIDLLPEGAAFYDDRNRRIWDGIIALRRDGAPADVVTLSAHLRSLPGVWVPLESGEAPSASDGLQAAGGLSYLARLIDATPSVAHVRAHAQLVADAARMRRLMDQCRVTLGEGYADKQATKDLIDRHEQAVFAIAHSDRSTLDVPSMRIVVGRCTDLAARAANGPGGILGYPTGIEKLDARTGGLIPGCTYVIAARPGQGKSALAMNMVDALVSRASTEHEPGYCAVVFSLEMPAEELAHRMICASAAIPIDALRKGELGDRYAAYLQHAERIARLPLDIDDRSSRTVLEMRAVCRRAQRKFGARKMLVVVDYLQLARGDAEADNREQEISSISRGLKALAKDFAVPVLELSQLNRGCEARQDKRPMLSDLRDSGAVEQDADLVWAIFRPEKYNPGKDKLRGLAEIICLKQRNGPVGSDTIAFRHRCASFEDPTFEDLERWGDTTASEYDEQPHWQDK